MQESQRCPLCGMLYHGPSLQHFSHHIIKTDVNSAHPRYRWICNLCSARPSHPIVEKTCAELISAAITPQVHTLQHHHTQPP
jgi:hypothetical protein